VIASAHGGFTSRLVLIAPADDSVVDLNAPANRGWDRSAIIELLGDEIASGTCEIVDGSALSDAERNDIYVSAMLAKPRAQVKGAFGPRRERLTTLGTLVPALVDYDSDDIYPMSLGRDGFWTIFDYLTRGSAAPD
jgi:hypothetical protein